MSPLIADELDTIERRESVRILLAVESGSRAWGFPSVDSDYDVRFLFLRPLDAYLSVTPPRDVIERPVDPVLDINGWDLRKALQLMLRSNAALIEWLSSPVLYRPWDRADEMLALAQSTASLTALAYHYQHQARRSFDSITAGESARLKTYCYALRAALALAWIDVHRAPPPMTIQALMAGLPLPESLHAALHELIARKRDTAENAATLRTAVLDAWIAEAVARHAPSGSPTIGPAAAARADAFFAALLR